MGSLGAQGEDTGVQLPRAGQLLHGQAPQGLGRVLGAGVEARSGRGPATAGRRAAKGCERERPHRP